MQIIKLDATESTNSYLKAMVKDNGVGDFTVVLAKSQYGGRGQMDGKWDSEPGKNLTFSLLKKTKMLDLKQQFVLNMAVSLGVYDTLNAFEIPRVKVKWPNDIMSGAFKICGILIENMVSGDKLKSVVIGIGLNVNQTEFPGNPKASSLKKQAQKDFDLEKVFKKLLQNIKISIAKVESENYESIHKDYQSNLFRMGLASTFQNPNGSKFSGIIRGVNNKGKLQVQLEDDSLKDFDLKEIKLLY